MAPSDIVHEGGTPGDDPDAALTVVQPWANAGVIGWIESVLNHFYRATLESLRERIWQGPPLVLSSPSAHGVEYAHVDVPWKPELMQAQRG